MFRTVIFGIIILINSVLMGQEIHIPKIPVYGTPIVGNTVQFQEPLYYIPHYIEYPAKVIITQPNVYYAPIPQRSIINYSYPTPVRNFIFGPNTRILYPPR